MSELDSRSTLTPEAQALADMPNQEAAEWLLSLANDARGRQYGDDDGLPRILTSFDRGAPTDKHIDIYTQGLSTGIVVGLQGYLKINTAIGDQVRSLEQVRDIPGRHLELLVGMRSYLDEERLRKQGRGIINSIRRFFVGTEQPS